MRKEKQHVSPLDRGGPALLTIFLLAWPTMVEQMLSVAVSYVDAAMVGQLGAEATAAVGCTSTLNWLIGSTVFALGVGFLAFIAREYGAGNREKAAAASAQALLTALAAGVVFTVLPLALSGAVPRWMQADPAIRAEASRYFFILYTPMVFRSLMTVGGTVLRAVGDTRSPMRVNVGVNVVNVVLNFLLIYPTRTVRALGLTLTLPGAGWGVAGAGAASAVSIALGGAGMLLLIWRHPVVSPKGRPLRPDWEVLRPCLKIALPVSLQRFATSLGYVAFASMINGLGTVASAAHAIANTAESAFYIPGYGMQAAASTLSGNTFGKRDRVLMRRYTRLLITLEIIIMTVSGGTLFLLAPAVMRLFTPDAAVVALGAAVLRMVSVTEPAYGVSIILEGIFQGVGDTAAPFRYNVACMWGIRIVGTFAALRFFGGGLTAAWGCMIAHNLCLAALMVRRYFTGRWNPLRAEP